MAQLNYINALRPFEEDAPARMLPENTDLPVTCACKGIRQCLICENVKGKAPLGGDDAKVILHFKFTENVRRYL